MTKPNLPAEISEFYVYEADGVTLVTDDNGNPVIEDTPNTRTLDDVKALIAQGKPEKAVKACYESYQKGKPHLWKDYVLTIDKQNTTIEQQRQEIEEHNAQLTEGETPQELPDYRNDWPDRNAEEYQTVDYDTWKLENYALFRASEYPNWETQLEHIYDNGVESWKTNVIDPVKAKYPKPEGG